MNYDAVKSAIEARIEALQGMPVLVKENTGFKPTLLTPWIRATMLPGEPVQVAQGDARILRFNGLLQVDVFIPANTGTESAAANSIVDYFNDNRFITINDSIVTIEKAWRGTAASETDWYRIPVLVRWMTFTH